jgi:archaellum component FlaF (FlaF/FlaG flagellin family)
MPEGVGYGSNIVAGAGLELNYVGSHCYAYSGLYLANTTAFTVLEFQTGKGYIVGEMQLNAAVDDDGPTSVNINSANILFNGISVALIRAGVAGDDTTPTSERQKLIIPPLTQVQVIVDSNGTESDRWLSVVFTGRVHK